MSKRKRDKPTNITDMEEEEEEKNSVININKQLNNEIINVEFEFSNVNEELFHGIKILLAGSFSFENQVNLSELADIIIKQREDVGTSIKADSNIFAVFSYIPITFLLSDKSCSNFAKSFLDIITSKINKYYLKSDKQQILSLFNGKSNIGLIISERAINLPEETIPPAYGLITKEINECKEVEENYNKRFDFDYLLLIGKYVRLTEEEKNMGKKMKLAKIDIEDKAYYKFEMFLFLIN